MAESAVDNKIQFSINQLLECLPKSEELNECEGIHPKQLTMYLSEVGLVSKQEFVDCNSIQSKTTYRFIPIYPESPNAGGLMNLVAEGKPVFAMVSLDLTKLIYIKDMSNIDIPYKCGSYEPSMYGIVSGYKYDEEMMEDSYWELVSNIIPYEEMKVKIPMTTNMTNGNYGGIAAYAFTLKVDGDIVIPTTQVPSTEFICSEQEYPTIEDIPSTATKLVFSANRYPSIATLDLSRFTELKELIFEDGSFSNCYSLIINNPSLKVLKIGNNCFTGSYSESTRRLSTLSIAIVIINAPNLTTIVVGNNSFTFITMISVGNCSSITITIGSGSFNSVIQIIYGDSEGSKEGADNIGSAIEDANPGKDIPVVPSTTPAPTPTPTVPVTPTPTAPVTPTPTAPITPTPTPTPTPESWFPIYDPFIFGDNCNYEKQETCVEEIIPDLHVLRLYLAIRDQYPTKALKHTRVLALMGMTEHAIYLLNQSLSKQELNPNPIDCYFYSDFLVPRYIDADLAIPLLSLVQYTYPSRLVFSDGTFKREGFAAILQWMVDNRNKGYFKNLKYFQIARHNLFTFKSTSKGYELQNQIISNLHTMCEDTVNFPLLEEMNFNGNGYNEYNNGFDTALIHACYDVTVRNVNIKASWMWDRPSTMCSGESRPFRPNYWYYDMTNPDEIDQCRFTWNWELYDEYYQYAIGPYPNSESVYCPTH